jgi:putative ABC transport system ATP-binding protein
MAGSLRGSLEEGAETVNTQPTLAVDVRGLRKMFGTGEARVEALRGIDLKVKRGEFVAVMGPSGSGKSTLLHLIGGLDSPSAGSIQVGDEDLAALDDDRLTLLRRRRIGFVFQAFNLLDVLSAEENVALPLLVDSVPEAEAQRRAGEALELVDLVKRKNHLPSQLSGGEQQRVAIARALVTGPLLLLADEPTGNLDSVSSDQIMTLLRSLVDEFTQTILMVTHNARHAAMADRILCLRDGLVVEQQELPRPRALGKVLEDLESLS